jgi:hypothetical protein
LIFSGKFSSKFSEADANIPREDNKFADGARFLRNQVQLTGASAWLRTAYSIWSGGLPSQRVKCPIRMLRTCLGHLREEPLSSTATTERVVLESLDQFPRTCTVFDTKAKRPCNAVGLPAERNACNRFGPRSYVSPSRRGERQIVSKTTLEQKAQQERRDRRMPWSSERHITSAGNNRVIANQVLDDTLEASFPASDPSAVTTPWTRIGNPRRSN